jgi:hypothetical protein
MWFPVITHTGHARIRGEGITGQLALRHEVELDNDEDQ